MKKLIALSLIPLLSGCLSASSPRVSQWLLEYKGPVRATRLAKYEVGRVSQVTVRSPYNEVGIAVLRADGSMAFDPYNEYAANPTAMLKGFVFDAMDASGLFGTVVNPSSSVKSHVQAEVLVRSPYNEVGIAVLRADGSMAFDPYNEYAANPTAMLKGFVFDAMDASGLFGTVVNPSSSVKAQAMSEVLVSRLALDCRKEGERKAVAAVRVRLIADDGKALYAQGEGTADAKDGNYGTALSDALSTALNTAFGQFR